MLNKTMLKLKTNRLNLRILQESDAEQMWPYVSNPDLPKYMSWEAHTDIEQTRKFRRESADDLKQGTKITWGIFKVHSFCGVISLTDIQWEIGACETGGTAELGYWLVPEAWGKGLMLEAIQAVLEFGFEQIKLRTVNVAHVSDNRQSQSVIEKTGFRYIGERKEYWKKNGIWYDHKFYELSSNDYIIQRDLLE